ncbi:hypothetical protein AAMO2058_000146600 [Amorphochlora amoebiformis]
MSNERLQFVFGVVLTTALAQLLVYRPEAFGQLCTILAAFTVAEKAVSYYIKGWHLFVLDFCYWVNFAFALIPLMPASTHRLMHAVLFLHANGPVAVAVPIWNQSLVFHDFERILSVGVHVFPMLISYCAAWHPYNRASDSFFKGYIQPSDLVYVFGSYFAWQVAYMVITNVILKSYLARNPQLLSSYRWIARDQKNGINVIITSMLRRAGIFGMKESMSDNDIRSELGFMFIQLIYTILTILLSCLVALGGKIVHQVFMVAVMASSLWNASAVYLEASEKDMKAPSVQEIDVKMKPGLQKSD